MRTEKCCMEQGHLNQFRRVLSDLEAIFDSGCPENSLQMSENESKLTQKKLVRKDAH
jgi:hypothetical protein